LTASDNDHRCLAPSPTTPVLSMPSKKGKNRAKRKNSEALQQGSQTAESPSPISQSAGAASGSAHPAVDQPLTPDAGCDQGTSQGKVTSVVLYTLANASNASVPHITNIYHIGTAGNVNTGPIYGKFACRQTARLLKLNGFRHTDHDIGERRGDGTHNAFLLRMSLI
jgi:hypothetical protein